MRGSLSPETGAQQADGSFHPWGLGDVLKVERTGMRGVRLLQLHLSGEEAAHPVHQIHEKDGTCKEEKIDKGRKP